MSKSDKYKFKEGDRVVYVGGLHDRLKGEDGIVLERSASREIYKYYVVRFINNNIDYTIREEWLIPFKEVVDEN
jgi:hypothetical protein